MRVEVAIEKFYPPKKSRPGEWKVTGARVFDFENPDEAKDADAFVMRNAGNPPKPGFGIRCRVLP